MNTCIRCGFVGSQCTWAVKGILCADCIRQDDIWFTCSQSASKKNRRIWIRRGGRRFLVPSKEAVESERDIRNAVISHMEQHHAHSFGHGDPVELHYCHEHSTRLVHVLVCRASQTELTTARSDVHGMLETIADALQGYGYKNDRQIVAGSFLRIP